MVSTLHRTSQVGAYYTNYQDITKLSKQSLHILNLKEQSRIYVLLTSTYIARSALMIWITKYSRAPPKIISKKSCPDPLIPCCHRFISRIKFNPSNGQPIQIGHVRHFRGPTYPDNNLPTLLYACLERLYAWQESSLGIPKLNCNLKNSMFI